LRLVLQATAQAANLRQSPLSHLLARLEEPDGRAWFERGLSGPPWTTVPGGAAAILGGTASLVALYAVKDHCKAAFRGGEDLDNVLTSVAGYFLAVAAALVHHGAVLSSQSRAELGPLLIDLATALPEPWSSLASRAAFVELREAGS